MIRTLLGRSATRLGLALAALTWVVPGANAADLNPCAAKTLNPCRARASNPCDAERGGGSVSMGMRGAAANPCNPCGANPCNPCGVGGRVDPARFQQPAGVRLASGSREGLVTEGEKLWNDRSLGKTGLACATCHTDDYGQMNATFGDPYPHYVAMPHQQGGVDQVSAAEMVNFCMIVPMGAEPLSWSSRELAALTAYVEHIQPGFVPASANPCNPCAGRNPCNPGTTEANPCNPCAAKRNPCNP